MAQFQIFKQNTDASATNRGFYYQYLKTVKLWLDNYLKEKNYKKKEIISKQEKFLAVGGNNNE